MNEMFIRTEILIGKEALSKLHNSRVAVFGAGGVGGYAIEALARSGVGAIDVIDNDNVSVSNINRQIYATTKTVGMAKVDVAAERISDINPDIHVTAHKVFYMPDTAHLFDFSEYDYIVDAIDTVTGKIELIVNAQKSGTPIISSMGAGNKLCPDMLKVSDIYKTSVCPLARVMRSELKKRGIKKLKVVYSEEKPITPSDSGEVTVRRAVPGSVAFVPSVAGLIIAGEVVKDLCGIKK